MGAVGLVFAPLAPLVAVAAAVVLWIFSWVYKYQLMFVFISKVESGGVRELVLKSHPICWTSPSHQFTHSVFGMSLSTDCCFPSF